LIQSIRINFIYIADSKGNLSLVWAHTDVTKRRVGFPLFLSMDSDFKFVRNLASEKERQYRYRSDAAEENTLLDSEPEIAEFQDAAKARAG
jgi:hypothetical protein